MKYLKEKGGITLIALVITIIILLILAGVTVATLTGDNGLLGKTGEAKKVTELSGEKELIEVEYINALGQNKLNNLEKIQVSLQQGLDKSFGENKTAVTPHGEGLDVLIVDKNYYYTIDEYGNITGPEEKISIEYAGDITKNNKYDGTTEEKAYRIECIEDLVKLSEIVKTTYIQDKYIVVTQDLDFKSAYSYNNYKTTEFGNLNGNAEDGNELYTEMTTGTGFNPIDSSGKILRSTFDGQSHWIKNLYINYATDNIGLFGKSISPTSTIKNLNITGNISGGNSTGGICGYGSSQIKNCKNYATISGKNNVGGITGKECLVESCENYGKITGTQDAIGGITGLNGKIKNSVNYGDIEGKSNGTGGIVGNSVGDTYYIEKCYNIGEVNGKDYVGGLNGWCQRGAIVVNSYNAGNVTAHNYVGGIIGCYGPNWADVANYIDNCYNVGKVSGTSEIGGTIGLIGGGYTNYYKNMYYLNTSAARGLGNKDSVTGKVDSKTESELKADAMITLLNGNNTGTETIWFKDTKNKNNGYPILNYQNN